MPAAGGPKFPTTIPLARLSRDHFERPSQLGSRRATEDPAAVRAGSGPVLGHLAGSRMSPATRDGGGRVAGRGCFLAVLDDSASRQLRATPPDETLLYQLIEEHWPTFLERAEQAGGSPDFIVEEFEVYLRCGILEHGLAHFACRCGESLVVVYSCKTRGFCPSCTGRRTGRRAG